MTTKIEPELHELAIKKEYNKYLIIASDTVLNKYMWHYCQGQMLM
jgi:hypothetical protein